MTLGLTGGIGCGKSAVADILEKVIPSISTDKIGHEMLLKDSPAYQALLSFFGKEVLDQKGHVSRSKLAELVFQDETKRKTLENIVHPLIRQEWKKRAHDLTKGSINSSGMVLVEIPLLFETHAENEFDQIICVACSAETQINRLIQNRKLSPEDALKRIHAQMPVAEKMEKSDFVIWNEFGLEYLPRQVSFLLEKFNLSAGPALK